jgi:hypothetical protein
MTSPTGHAGFLWDGQVLPNVRSGSSTAAAVTPYIADSQDSSAKSFASMQLSRCPQLPLTGRPFAQHAHVS